MAYPADKASANPTGSSMPMKVKSLVGPAGKQLNAGSSVAAGGSKLSSRKLGGK